MVKSSSRRLRILPRTTRARAPEPKNNYSRHAAALKERRESAALVRYQLSESRCPSYRCGQHRGTDSLTRHTTCAEFLGRNVDCDELASLSLL